VTEFSFRVDRAEYLGSERIAYGVLDGLESDRKVTAKLPPAFRSKAFAPARGTPSRLAIGPSFISTVTADEWAGTEGAPTTMVAIAESSSWRTSPLSRMDRPEVLGPLFVAPAIIYVLVLVGVPFLLAVYYAVSAYTIYDPSYRFVGLRNVLEVVQSAIFLRTLANTFVFTIASQMLGLILGKFGTLLLLRPFPGRRIARALVILPWAVPVALATLAWKWMFGSLYSVMYWVLVALGLVAPDNVPQWLGQPDLAMVAVIVVNAWRFFPFAIVIFLAGITAIPQDVVDAATIDGAGFWRLNYQIIVPMIAPIILVGVIFGTVFTFTDLSIVYLLIGGGSDERHPSPRVVGLSGRYIVRRRGAWRCDLSVLVPVPVSRGRTDAARCSAPGALTWSKHSSMWGSRPGST
jgi:multiple sugar transport system permease protein